VINEREAEVRERAAELGTINRITQALSRQLDMDSLIQLVGDQVRDLFHAPIAYVSPLDRDRMMLQFPYTYGEEAKARPFGEGLTSQIIRTGQPLLINEDMEGNRAKVGVKPMGRTTASYLGVPIPSGGEVIRVVSVQSTEQEGRFSEADQRYRRWPPLSAWPSTTRNCSKMPDRPGPRPRTPMPPRVPSSPP
jgi:transcriptional regulator with GAF, ATPase, and Fis domain